MVRRSACLALVLAASTALADEPVDGGAPPAADAGVSAEQRLEAERLVEEGTEAYKRGDYAKAAILLDRAYTIVPTPRILFNIARAWERAGDNRRAMAYYVRYLKSGDAEPDLAKRAAIALDTLRDKLGEPVAPRSTAAASSPPPPAEPPAHQPPLRSLGIAGVVAGAVVLIGSGIVDALVIADQLDEFEAAKQRGDGTARDEQQDVRTAQVATLVGYIAGGLLGVGGATLIVLSARGPSSSPPPPRAGRSSLAPFADRGGAGARWAVRW